MLPEEALKFWIKVVKILHQLFILPYSWNAQSFSFTKSKSHPKFRYWTFVFQFSIVVAYEIFQIFRGIQVLATSKEPFVSHISLLFSIQVYILLNANEWIVLRNYDAYSGLFRDFLRLCQHHREPWKESKRTGRNLKWSFVMILLGVSGAALRRGLGVLKNPGFPGYLSSLHSNPHAMPIGMRVIFAYIHLHKNAFHYSMFAFTLMAAVIYNFGLVEITKKLSRFDSGCMRLETAQNLMKSYRELEVLQSQFNTIFRGCIFYWEVTAISASVLNLFLGIILGNVRTLVVGVLSLGIGILEFEKFAAIYEESDKTLWSWKRAVKTRECSFWFRRFHRSARQLRIQIGGYYYADKQLVLTMLSIVASNTANLILTFLYESLSVSTSVCCGFSLAALWVLVIKLDTTKNSTEYLKAKWEDAERLPVIIVTCWLIH